MALSKLFYQVVMCLFYLAQLQNLIRISRTGDKFNGNTLKPTNNL